MLMTETVLNRSPLAPAISPRHSARLPARESRREPLSAALIYSAIGKYLNAPLFMKASSFSTSSTRAEYKGLINALFSSRFSVMQPA
jgi:hypothetical protein